MLLSLKRSNSTATAGSRRSVASLPVRAYVHVPTWVWLRRRKGYRGLSAMNDCGARNVAWLSPYALRYACKFRATSTLPGPLREFTRKLDFLRSSRLPRDGESASRTGSSDPHRMRLELPILRFFISRPLVALDGGSFRYGARDTNPTDLTQSRPEARPPKCVWNRFLKYQP